MKYLSFCIPTNGILEWVLPVIDNIYSQGISEEEYEIIVTDNGDDCLFQEKMQEIELLHTNFIYKKTSAYMFENQIEALKLGTGAYLKFLNHRSIIKQNTIEFFLKIIKENYSKKPVMYFSNGTLGANEVLQCSSFDSFVRELGDIASWTTGVGVWKEDFEKIEQNHEYNKISPHSDVLFLVKDREEYYIYNQEWSHDIDESHVNKGKYDLYKAFAIEEPSITLGLYLEGSISIKTLKKVLNDYKKRVALFYAMFNINKIPCSYNISGFDDAMGIYMRKEAVIRKAYGILLKDFVGRVKRRLTLNRFVDRKREKSD